MIENVQSAGSDVRSKGTSHRHPYRLAGAGVLLFVTLIMACRAPQAADETQVPATTHARTQGAAMDSNSTSSTDSDPAFALDAAVRKGMAYADFRKKVFDLGWKPIVDPQCKANVAGADHAELCASNADLTSCKICDELPELSSCSSDAHCLMRFRQPASGVVLEATGYGEVKYWNESGDEAGLQVSGWEVTGGAADN